MAASTTPPTTIPASRKLLFSGSTGGRAGNVEVNKSVRLKTKRMGITPKNLGKEEFDTMIMEKLDGGISTDTKST